jgi:uncharacterized metal-binding protein (TIGR02443 family)
MKRKRKTKRYKAKDKCPVCGNTLQEFQNGYIEDLECLGCGWTASGKVVARW